MHLLDSLPRFAVALGIGLLIGLERGWHTREMKPGTRAAGIRTFAISSLLGASAGALAHAITDVGFFLGAILLAFAVIIILFSWGESRTTGRNSATTAIAALLTFSLGAFSVLDDMRVAAAAAVVTAGTLAAREDIHSWVARIT
jgi:uncharacterized membrane protein (DUF4010 family)